MQWKTPVRWAELKNGINCPMCLDFPVKENQFSFLITELTQSYVRLPKNQYYPGYVIVGLKKHANELFELSTQELSEYWQDVALVAKALDEIYHPAKIDYCIFGHHCPHVHCHLIMQTFDNDPSLAVKPDEKEVFLQPQEYQSIIDKLRLVIGRIKDDQVK
jgi:diadenosine tetraphosphate (Ap4A) HIT family hydrolase